MASPYSHLNLLDLEPSGPGPQLEMRMARKHLDSRDLGVSHERYAPGFRNARSHRHGEQEEAYVVVSGSGRARVGDEIVELRQWDVLRIAPETVRALEAGPDGLEVIAIGGPRPQDGDGELVDAPWPDEA